MNTELLTNDAKNRALRTFVQNLGVDVLVAVIAVLLPLVQDANSFGDFEWAIIGFSLAKTVALTIFAFVMRRFLDSSALPTPVPPEYPGEPADDVTPQRAAFATPEDYADDAADEVPGEERRLS